MIGISVAAGATVKAWGLPVPALYLAGWYLARGSAGAFVNHSGNGDNLAALGFFSATIWCVVGLLAVLVGLALRLVAQRALRAH